MRAQARAVRRVASKPEDDPSLGWVGRQMRDLRKARGLTLKALSAKSKLSIGLLSQMERGISTPSIRSLHALSRALDVPPNWFFHTDADKSSDERGIVVRRGGGRVMSFASDGFRKELVTPDLSGALEGVLVTIDPGGSSGDEPYNHPGEELGFVILGQLDLWVDDRRFRLGPGDCFRFASMRMHRFANPGPTETRVLWVVTPPFY